jgi:3-oxoacyl-(acyl-carrier-protein) synthase
MGVVYDMAGPLRNRFNHFTLEPCVDSWTKWAMNNDVSPDIIAWVNHFKNKLHNFSGNVDEMAFCTPRSLVKASKMYKRFEGKSNVAAYVGSAIGLGNAVEFIAYTELKRYLPKFEDIFDGSVTSLDPNAKNNNISIQYSLVTNGISALKKFYDEVQNTSRKTEFRKANDNFITFMMNNAQKEMLMFFFNTVQKTNPHFLGQSKGNVSKEIYSRLLSSDFRKYTIIN